MSAFLEAHLINSLYDVLKNNISNKQIVNKIMVTDPFTLTI